MGRLDHYVLIFQWRTHELQRPADLIAAVSDTVAVSAGSACHSDTVKLSPVIAAIGVPMEWAPGTIRFSTGKYTTDEEIDRAAAVIVGAWRALTHRG